MNWTEIAKGSIPYALLFAVGFFAAWLWRDSYWKDSIETAPIVQRDTVLVERIDTLRFVTNAPPLAFIDSSAVDSLLESIASSDSTTRQIVLYLASPAEVDTVIVKDDYTLDLSVLYNPLYRDFAIRADVLTKHELITNTKLIYDKPPWWQYALLGASSAVTAYGVAKEDYVLASIGAGALITVSITL